MSDGHRLPHTCGLIGDPRCVSDSRDVDISELGFERHVFGDPSILGTGCINVDSEVVGDRERILPAWRPTGATRRGQIHHQTTQTHAVATEQLGTPHTEGGEPWCVCEQQQLMAISVLPAVSSHLTSATF